MIHFMVSLVATISGHVIEFGISVSSILQYTRPFLSRNVATRSADDFLLRLYCAGIPGKFCKMTRCKRMTHSGRTRLEISQINSRANDTAQNLADENWNKKKQKRSFFFANSPLFVRWTDETEKDRWFSEHGNYSF